ncbi:MAG TPA: cellulase family glycosylhydrolase [Acidobacteriaceae bacterium]|nr:cellulase family glycosylhydrolase [Acidobacteriaceae bacterium]
MRTIRFAAPTILLFSLLAACGSTSTGPSDPPPPPPTTGAQAVGVSGTHMTLDGQPWMSRGVVLQAFVRPLAALQASTQTQVLHARLNYGAAELDAIHSYHADTIRFQIGQPALDPASPLYDPHYFTDVVNAIKQARQAGFVVMIMMQDEKISGESVQYPLPIAETQRDWDLFTTAFGSDRGVVFELYNEPSLTPSPANWQLWLNGGMVAGQTEPSIGMQPLINHIRANGAQNVFVLDGLGRAATLEGMPAVSDPLNRLVYAVHPYQHGSADESQWDAEFGIPSATLPVWADEWSAPTQLQLGLGTLTSYQVAVDLVNYLRAHSIPLCTGAFDVPHFVVQDIPGWTLTNYDNYSNTSTIEGSGTLVYNDFAANYSRPLTAADGLSRSHPNR